MINCILIDDEPFARETLEDYIQRVPSLKLLGSFEDPLTALEFIDSDIDLIFSDIQMPEMDGISFLKTLKNPPRIIFISGHRDFAIEGYDLDILDFILKPYSFDRFLKAVNKAKDAFSKSQNRPSHLVIHDGYRNSIVHFVDIKYIKGLEDYVTIVTREKSYISKTTMKNMEVSLPDNFMRIQKSYIVNINYLESVTAGTAVLKENDQLPIGLKYRDDFFKKLGINR